jgi:hypothetical protein
MIWSPEKARAWFDAQPLPCGFNHIPANSINYTEMWMDYCFDPVFIEKEMLLARECGFNCARVVLPFVVWENEPEAFKKRFASYLEICRKCGVKIMPSLFDDCGFGDQVNPVFGKQPDVIPGWYANGWTPSPGHDIVRDPAQWRRLEPYLKDIIGVFKDDPRVWVWDLYNEPTNGVSIGALCQPLGDVSLPLVEKVFAWAREINPMQPLTIGIWNGNGKLNEIALANSDVVTFHCYDKPEFLLEKIAKLKACGRPLICTEWLARGNGSTVAGCLPVFKSEKVGAMHWGLVNGKTQTHLNWRHLPGQPISEIWQHDLFKADHTPYDPEEIRLLNF